MLRAIPTAVSAAQRLLTQPVAPQGLSPLEQDHFERMQIRNAVDCVINVLSPLTRPVGGSIEEQIYTLQAVLMSQSAARKRGEELELGELAQLKRKTADQEELKKIDSLAQARQERLRELNDEARNQAQMLNQVSQALQDSVRQVVRA